MSGEVKEEEDKDITSNFNGEDKTIHKNYVLIFTEKNVWREIH